MSLRGKHIVLCVSGGIAAYKAVDLCRLLVDAGAHVAPVMTADAEHFIGKTTLSALASEPVHTTLWDDANPIPHTRLAQRADLIVVAPATARVIGSYAAGISSDFLTATLIATRAPVLVCPAMHTEMWEHASVQENIATLRRRGVNILEPETGRLAGGDVGAGRLAEPQRIFTEVEQLLTPGDLYGAHVVVTAGGTREPIDAVRVIANRSTGKQGYAIAIEAVARGAKVTLISTADLPTPFGVNLVQVETAQQMMDAVNAEAKSADVVVMAAAVADVRPVRVATHKLKKDPLSGQIDDLGAIKLEATPDILAGLGKNKPAGQVLVGFAAETENLIANAQSKLERKGADLIVANDVSQDGVGFAHATNAVTLVARGAEPVEVALADKRSIARSVLNAVVAIRSARTN
uniref:Coenzyme A biosynthesis bifunctional protein CoaBC n=1 Tax=uncultured Actinomycetes bacterium TaxID=152507 RepID=D0U634_9ACTN|nr:phosphopantothenoylcysteine decarboxylase [uncultured Actinomycetes bacterium]